jgi:hypothetical protein
MYLLEQTIPGYLTTRQNITRTVLFTALFALAFINFYAPFGVNVWLHVTKPQLFLYSSLVILTGVLVVAISRIIMYHYSKKNKITHLSYYIWVLVEIVSMAAFYSLFGLYVMEEKKGFFDTFQTSIRNTALVILLPYSILWLYFSWRDKAEQLEKFKEKDSGSNDKSKRMFPFHDDKGVLKFSILGKDLLYLEAADNYVQIHYNDKQKVSRFMIRNTLKKLEETLSSKTLTRCHRSYIVNFERVKIIRKEKEGLYIDLDCDPGVSLPVSKTYMHQVIEGFSEITE